MADALASGASGSNTVWVQVPSPARVKTFKIMRNHCFGGFFNVFYIKKKNKKGFPISTQNIKDIEFYLCDLYC